MPRERIYDIAGNVPGGPETHSGLEISWWPQTPGGAPGHVQLGTGTFPQPPEGVIATRTGDDGEEPPLTAEQPRFVTLDRDGINRAIRKLRRARDAAFGPDA